MLVIVKDRNVATLDQGFFDLEALGRFDVFQVDATPGIGNARHGVDERLRAFSIHFDIHRVDARKALEQDAFALHDRLAGQRPQVAQAKNRATVRNDRNQVALAGIAVRIFRFAGDFANRLGNAWAIRQGQVPRCRSGLGQLHGELTGNRFSVIIQSCLFVCIRHGQGLISLK